MQFIKRCTFLLALVGLSVFIALPLFAGNEVGQAAEDFGLQPAEGGNTVSLLDFKGKPTLVIFWATWCPPCRREIPDLKAIQKDYAAKGLQMVSVAINFRETREDVVRFKQANELPYMVLWDEGNKISDRYAVEGIPTVLLVDPQGIIRYREHQIDRRLIDMLDEMTKAPGKK